MLTLMKGSLLLNKWLCSPELPSLIAKGEAQTLISHVWLRGICFVTCIFNQTLPEVAVLCVVLPWMHTEISGVWSCEGNGLDCVSFTSKSYIHQSDFLQEQVLALRLLSSPDRELCRKLPVPSVTLPHEK